MTHPAFAKYPAPCARREVKRAVIEIMTAAMICLAAWLLSSHLVQIDHFQGVFGISAGTNNNYCYLDLDQGHALVWGCESAK